MPALPLAHVSWAIADNDERKACDAWFIDLFGAETASEIILTPENAHYGFDREERLMMVGDTMLIPIAPAGPGLTAESPTGEMLRRSAGPGRWLGLALRVADLKTATDWFADRGFKLHFDPGMEGHYFLIGRKQALGVRLEILGHELPGDPRHIPGWTPRKWAQDHPLGIEGLQSVGVSAPSAEVAREVFGQRLDLREIGARALPGEDAHCVAFDLGDTVIEALVPTRENGDLARHLASTQGIYCLTFKVRSAECAAEYLRGRGLDLVGDIGTRFAIRPDQAYDRLIWFTDKEIDGFPPLGSRLNEPAQFSVAA